MRTLILLLSLLGLAQPAVAADINGQLKRADLENLSADPSLKATGRVYFNTSSAKAKYWSGSAWLTVVDTTNTLLNGAVQNPMASLGDLIYGASAGTPTALSGNTTTTKKFLTQTGTGTVSAVPAWGTVADSDLPVTLSGHTLGAPTLSTYGDLTEQGSAPSSPASSTLRVYAKTDDRLYTLNNSGVETQVGSGSGEKNYLSKGTSTAAGWTASGAGVTCTTVTTGLPDATVGTALAVTGVSGSTAYCFSNFDLDSADYNKKMKIAFDQAPVSGYAANDQRTDVYSCTVAWSGTPATTCSGTATRLPLSTDSSSVSALPNLTGTYRTTWDSPGSAAAHIQVRVGLNGTNTHQNNLAQIVTGPGVVTQGAAVSQWQSYTPTTAGFGTLIFSNFLYRRVGDSIEVSGTIQIGIPSASTASVSLPSGLTSTGLNNGQGIFTEVGKWDSNQSPAGVIIIGSGGGSTLNFAGTGSGNIAITGNAVASSVTNAAITLFFRLPIDQWAGSGTVNLAQSDLSYYYGTGGTWGTSSTVTTAQGPGGVLGGTTTPSGTFFRYTLPPTTPVPVGAVPQLQISSDQLHWRSTGSYDGSGLIVESLRNDGTNWIGAGVAVDSSGNLSVMFGKYANSASAVWTGTWYWRVVVGLSGQAVGFGIVQPGVSSGLVSALGVPGNTTGSAAPSGNVGQTLTNTFGPTAATTSGGGFQVGSTYTLPAGTWLIFGYGFYNNGTATSNTYALFDINTSNSLRTNLYTGISYGGSTLTTTSAPIYQLIVTSSGTTSIFALSQYNYASLGNSNVSISITALRIY